MKKLDHKLAAPEILEIESTLLSKVVGQDRAVKRFVKIMTVDLAGLSAPGHPMATLLFLGPTGSGKTRLVEAVAEALYQNPAAMIKVDCAEYSHGHEVAKLVGAPPGYLGHNETKSLLSQEILDQYHNNKHKTSLVLFDEIEKASSELWQLLLGVLDKATLTTGHNEKIDFSRSIIFMTSNLGSKAISALVDGGIGYRTEQSHNETALDQRIYEVAFDAARRWFSPEFMNRIDRVIVFRSLTRPNLFRILDLELDAVQARLFRTPSACILRVNQEAKEFLVNEGTDSREGARHLKKAIERFIVVPLSNLISTGQIGIGDIVYTGFDGEELEFYKDTLEVSTTYAK